MSESKLVRRFHRKTSISRNLTLLLSIIFLVSLVYGVDANGALINKDLISIGDQLIILDTDSNLEWLSLDATMNRSIDSLITGTAGVDYLGEYGFHFANQEELGTFWGHAGVPLSTGTYTTTYTSAIAELISILGTPSPGYSGSEIVGESLLGYYNLYGGEGCAIGYHQTASLTVLYSGLSAASSYSSSCVTNSSGTTRGKYLLRTSPVPIPGALYLFTFGVLTLIVVGRFGITSNQSPIIS